MTTATAGMSRLRVDRSSLNFLTARGAVRVGSAIMPRAARTSNLRVRVAKSDLTLNNGTNTPFLRQSSKQGCGGRQPSESGQDCAFELPHIDSIHNYRSVSP